MSKQNKLSEKRKRKNVRNPWKDAPVGTLPKTVRNNLEYLAKGVK